MPALMKLLHVLAAIAWLGGIAFMLLALRPVATKLLSPPERVPLMVQILQRFFALVWASIAVLVPTGLAMLLGIGMRQAPIGWHLMLGLGLLMSALFAYVYFGPFRRLRQASDAGNWPQSGQLMGQIASLAGINLGLGVTAIAATLFVI